VYASRYGAGQTRIVHAQRSKSHWSPNRTENSRVEIRRSRLASAADQLSPRASFIHQIALCRGERYDDLYWSSETFAPIRPGTLARIGVVQRLLHAVNSGLVPPIFMEVMPTFDGVPDLGITDAFDAYANCERIVQ
jgi:hypothetical protein